MKEGAAGRMIERGKFVGATSVVYRGEKCAVCVSAVFVGNAEYAVCVCAVCVRSPMENRGRVS